MLFLKKMRYGFLSILGISVCIYAYWLFGGAFIESSSSPLYAKILLGVFGISLSLGGLVLNSLIIPWLKSFAKWKITLNPFVLLLIAHVLALLAVSIIAIPIQNLGNYLSSSISLPLRFGAVYLVLSFALALVLVKKEEDKTAASLKEPSLPIALTAYFLLLSLPYLFSDIEAINNILTARPGIYIYRGITSLLLLGYVLYLTIKFKLPLSWNWIAVLGMLFMSGVIGVILTPKHIAIGNYESHITTLDALIEIARLAVSCLTLYAFVCLFPQVGEKRSIFIPMLSIVALVLICCLYSYIKEGGEYYGYLTATRQHKQNIRSFFNSKNDFGMFLFFASFASLYLLINIKHKSRYAFMASYALFLFTSFCIQCYTSLIPSLVLGLGFFIYGLIRLYPSKKKLSIGITIGALVIALSFILCLFVPPIYSNVPVFDALHTQVLYFFSTEINTRTDLWGYLPKVLNGGYAYLGKGDFGSTLTLYGYLLQDEYAYLVSDFHSSYVSMLASRGLIGCLVYAYVLCYALSKIIKGQGKKAPMAILFASYLLFAMPETYVLGLSMSISTLPFSMVFLGLGKQEEIA